MELLLLCCWFQSRIGWPACSLQAYLAYAAGHISLSIPTHPRRAGILFAQLTNYWTGKIDGQASWRIPLGVYGEAVSSTPPINKTPFLHVCFQQSFNWLPFAHESQPLPSHTPVVATAAGAPVLLVLLAAPFLPDSPDSYIARRQLTKARRTLEVGERMGACSVETAEPLALPRSQTPWLCSLLTVLLAQTQRLQGTPQSTLNRMPLPPTNTTPPSSLLPNPQTQRLRGTKEVEAEWEDIAEETQGTEAKRRALISHVSSRQAGAGPGLPGMCLGWLCQPVVRDVCNSACEVALLQPRLACALLLAARFPNSVSLL